MFVKLGLLRRINLMLCIDYSNVYLNMREFTDVVLVISLVFKKEINKVALVIDIYDDVNKVKP